MTAGVVLATQPEAVGLDGAGGAALGTSFLAVGAGAFVAGLLLAEDSDEIGAADAADDDARAPRGPDDPADH